MKTGLWTTCPTRAAIDRALNAIPLSVDGDNDDASMFLYGMCSAFALALNELYGYPIEIIPDEDMEDPLMDLCHVCCIVPTPDGKRTYADVRGMTDYWHDLTVPFEGVMEYHEPVDPETLKAECCRLMGQAVTDQWIDAAEELIRSAPAGTYAIPAGA